MTKTSKSIRNITPILVGPADVARLCGVSQNMIKRWGIIFAEFLSSSATPTKGQERRYTQMDLQVFAVIAEDRDWQQDSDDQDYSSVFFALNNGRQFEERYQQIAYLHTPIFQEVPEEIDESWQHGMLYGGMAKDNLLDIARAYRKAGEVLVSQALTYENAYELTFPIFYVYRHALELYLKLVSRSDVPKHDLDMLIKHVERASGKSLSPWAKKALEELHLFDQRGTAFRYGEQIPLTEVWINLHQLKVVYGLLCDEFDHLLVTHA